MMCCNNIDILQSKTSVKSTIIISVCCAVTLGTLFFSTIFIIVILILIRSKANKVRQHSNKKEELNITNKEENLTELCTSENIAYSQLSRQYELVNDSVHYDFVYWNVHVQ